MPSKTDARPRRPSRSGKVARPSAPDENRSRGTQSRTRRRKRRSTLLVPSSIAALALAAGTVIAILIHYEKAIPPLLAQQPAKADSVLVDKSERSLSLIHGGQVYRTYSIALGREPVGHKRREGDLRTPEGRYLLDWRNPDSCCYKSLHVSYPSSTDSLQAAERGDDPGGLIMIHGQENGWGWLGWLMQNWDWTHGCIAVRNVPMEEIWRAVDDGTPIEIRP